MGTKVVNIQFWVLDLGDWWNFTKEVNVKCFRENLA